MYSSKTVLMEQLFPIRVYSFGKIGELNETDADLGLQVRIGINTGETVVSLGARPELGEGIVAGFTMPRVLSVTRLATNLAHDSRGIVPIISFLWLISIVRRSRFETRSC